MRLGRLDAETTANVGMIEGGTAINVVPERCRVEAEVRSLDDARAAAVATETVDHLQDGANAAECDVDVDVEQMFRGYRTRPSAPQVAVAERALRALRLRAEARSTPAARRTRTRCSCGGFRVHEPRRRDRAQPRAGRADQREALEDLLEIAIALVDEAAASERERGA